MERVYPYDDEYMTYDYINHRYTLTKEAIYQNLGINLDTQLNNNENANPSNYAQMQLNRISRVVYNWVYANGGVTEWQEYQLAKNPNLRNVIFEMLISQFEYTILNGMVWNQSGLHPTKGKLLERKDIMAAQVSPEVQEMAINSGIMYVGLEVRVPQGEYRRGY